VIAAELREKIASGQLSAGDTLPTVTEVAALYNVAVGTAHRAIDLLCTDGLIEVSRGRRAGVAPRA
jgi:DNA-binding GntR family transcriptional regulator